MPPSKTISVLIAEDDFMVSELIREMVETLAYTVVGAAINGRKAVEMTESLKPDVVLMDIEMPEMDGLEATQRIIQACLAPVVILSAYDTPEIEKQAARAGAGAYMLKMPNIRDIERTIAIAIARFDDMKELRRLNLELRNHKKMLQKSKEKFRKSSDNALEFIEKSFSNTVKNTHEMVWETDAGGLYTYVNPAAEKIFGYQPEAMIGKKHFYDLFHPENKKERKQVAFEMFARQQPLHKVTNRMLHKNGRDIWVLTSGVPVINAQGVLAGYRGTDLDITAQLQTRETLRRYQQIISSTNDLMAFIDRDYVYLEVNNAHVQAHRKTRREIVGRTVADLFGRDFFKQAMQEKLDRCLAGEKIRFQTWFDFPLMGRRYLDVSFVPFIDAKGVITGVVATSHDSTDRKQTEKKLASAKAFSDNMINAMPNPVFVKNERHQWIMVNDAFCRFIGHSQDELLGKSDYDFFPREEADEFWKYDNRVFASGRTHINEEEFTASDGAIHTILTHKSAITDLTGKHILIGVITDVSELKQARVTAEAANCAKSKFLTNMSHEIRTPLNAVLGFTELLCMEENDASKRKRLNIIKKSGENLLSLINDILDFSKIEADKLEIVPARFDIIEMLEYLQKTFTPPAEAKSLTFHLNFEMKKDAAFPPNVIGDWQRICQILTNLLSNAVKFTSEGGISLTYSYEAGQAGFKVTDTGIGIAKEKQDLVFAPFSQADVTTSRDFGGTGLGLAISRQLVKMMGGTLTLKSAPDIGSTFFVRLPLPNVAEQNEQYRLTAELKNMIDGEAMVARWLRPGDYGYDRPEYVRLALLDLPAQTARLRDAVKHDRQKDIEFIAHAIKGATGNLNMTEIYEAASAINDESVKKKYDINVIKYLFNNFKAILATVPEEYFKDDMAELLNRLGNKSETSDFKILMAEDNMMNQLLISDLLQRVNLGVAIAQNGREALDMLSRDKYDLLLLDIQMPVMDGLETIARIRADGDLKNLYVIALTAHAIKGDAEKYIKAGCDDYLAKPIKSAKLYQKIGTVMRRKD